MAQQFAATVQTFYKYFDVLIEDRRNNPRDDLATLDFSGQAAGRRVPAAPYPTAGSCRSAPPATTPPRRPWPGPCSSWPCTRTSSRGCKRIGNLIGKPYQEGLRYVAVKHFMRRAEQDHELPTGSSSRAIECRCSSRPAATRDLFTDPNTFDIDHARTITWPSFGPYTCVGQHLAKLELRGDVRTVAAAAGFHRVLGPRRHTPTSWVASSTCPRRFRCPDRERCPRPAFTNTPRT